MFYYLLLISGLIIIFKLIFDFLNNNNDKYKIDQAVVLVTGAGHGLGQTLCFQLAKENCRIICVDINETDNNETVNQIKKKYPNCIIKAFTCDISNYEQIKHLIKDVLQEFDHVDILINNAGIIRSDKFENFTATQLRKIVDVNILGTLWLTNELLPSMKARDHGCIVSISSMGGVFGVRHMIPYCATKFAVTGFMQGLKNELSFDGSNVRTVCVHPSFMKTAMYNYSSKNDGFLRRILFMDDLQTVARMIIDGIKKGKTEIFTRIEMLYGLRLLELIPPVLKMYHDRIPIEDFIANTDDNLNNRNYKKE